MAEVSAPTPTPVSVPPSVPNQSSSSFTSFQKTTLIILIVGILAITVVYALYMMRNSKNGETAKNESNVPAETAAGPAVSFESGSSAPVGDGNDINADYSSTALSTAPVDVNPAVKEPDLYVKNYYFSENPKIGNEFTVRIEIGNKGNLEARNFNWEWWPTSSGRACKEEVDVIPAWGARTVDCNYTYDDSGNYATKVIVDSNSDVQESNENNNVATKTVNLEEKPDLYVSALSFNHDPVMGAEFKVSITIKNKGGDTSDHSNWEWWATSAVKACDGDIGGLDHGESKTVTCSYTYPSWANYTTKAIVDSDGDISESNEGNNTYTKAVTPKHLVLIPFP